MAVDRLENIVSLAKRRGFVYPSSDIYGGLRASWDYGPLGVELKNNVKRQWWKSMVMGREDVVVEIRYSGAFHSYFLSEDKFSVVLT